MLLKNHHSQSFYSYFSMNDLKSTIFVITTSHIGWFHPIIDVDVSFFLPFPIPNQTLFPLTSPDSRFLLFLYLCRWGTYGGVCSSTREGAGGQHLIPIIWPPLISADSEPQVQSAHRNHPYRYLELLKAQEALWICDNSTYTVIPLNLESNWFVCEREMVVVAFHPSDTINNKYKYKYKQMDFNHTWSHFTYAYDTYIHIWVSINAMVLPFNPLYIYLV